MCGLIEGRIGGGSDRPAEGPHAHKLRTRTAAEAEKRKRGDTAHSDDKRDRARTMFSPPAVMMSSLMRPVMDQKPSASMSATSPECSHPSASIASWRNGVVCVCVFWGGCWGVCESSPSVGRGGWESCGCEILVWGLWVRDGACMAEGQAGGLHRITHPPASCPPSSCSPS